MSEGKTTAPRASAMADARGASGEALDAGVGRTIAASAVASGEESAGHADACVHPRPLPHAGQGKTRDEAGRFVPSGMKARKKPARKAVAWSAKRERTFLEALGRTANVAGALRASGLAETTVYRRRQDHEDFRAAWGVALREGVARLEMLLLERALSGVEPAAEGAKAPASARDFDKRLCLALLSAHRGTVYATAAVRTGRSAAERRAAVSARLSEINRRLGGRG